MTYSTYKASTGMAYWAERVRSNEKKNEVEFYAHRSDDPKSATVVLSLSTLAPISATGNKEALEHLVSVAIPEWVEKNRPPEAA